MTDCRGDAPTDIAPIETAGAEGQAEALGGPREIETWLREHGISGRKAKAAASAAWRVIGSEPDDNEVAGELVDVLETALCKIRRIRNV